MLITERIALWLHQNPQADQEVRDLLNDASEQLATCRAELAAERDWANDAHHRLCELYTLVQQVLNLIEKFRVHEEAEDVRQAGAKQ